MRLKWIGLILALSVQSCSDPRDQLMQELTDPSPIKRSGALRVLAKEGDAEAYRLLNHGLQDGSVIVRIAAVQSLAIFKGRDTTPALIRAARDADPEVREAVVIALTSRGGDQADRILVDILQEEPSPKVRHKITESLKQLGLTGERLAGKMSAAQMELVKKRWEKARPAQRAKLTRLAGRSIHPEGIQLVAQALADPEAEVVLAALEVLDGRGDKEILRQLLRLASDQAQKIRLVALAELGRHGSQGLAVIRGALRDLDPEVRLKALEELARNDQELSAEALCPLVTDRNPELARSAARLIGQKNLECDLSDLEKLLNAGGDDYQNTLFLLSHIQGESARRILAAELKRLPAEKKPLVAAALVRAGDRSRPVVRLLERSLKSALDDLLNLSQSWVGGRLSPRRQGLEKTAADPDEDESKLSEEQLKNLYKKHGLPPASPDSPRGVADILQGFPEASKGGRMHRLFLPAMRADVDRVAELLSALAMQDSESAGRQAARCLSSDLPALAARAARISLGYGLKFDLSRDQLAHLSGFIGPVPETDAAAIAELIGTMNNDPAAALLTGLLDRVSYEKREHLVSVLGKMKTKQSVPALTDLLTGYSAASAARALGEIGDPEATEGLKQALANAGPSAKMSILMALAKLGCEDILPMLTDSLSDPEPELRRLTVSILGSLGGQKALQLLQLARYDPDRMVSSQAQKYLAGK